MSTSRLLSLAALGILWPNVPTGRADLPPDAEKMLKKYQEETDAIKAKAEKDLKAKREKIIKDLQAMESDLIKAGKLKEAAAIAVRVRGLLGLVKPQPDPGTLSGFRGKVGETYHFQVTGNSAGGSVWGSGIYTDDSSLAMACVHAGILKNGETGVVKVTIIAGQNAYTGSTANGV